MGNETINILNNTSREKALNTLVRRFNGDRTNLCKMHGQMQENVTPPQLPPRYNFHSKWPTTNYPHSAYQLQPNFFFTLAPYQSRFHQRDQSFQSRNSQLQFRPFQNNQQPPPRPFTPKPTQCPKPMEVDESIRTRNINYTNRPKSIQQFQ